MTASVLTDAVPDVGADACRLERGHEQFEFSRLVRDRRRESSRSIGRLFFALRVNDDGGQNERKRSVSDRDWSSGARR